ncbi:MAG: site-specific integrase [Acutalibacteraceae bacterium]|nr:site-specific integrase [Acutalibacteraceae bacterium]
MAIAKKLPSGNYRVQATVMLDGKKIKRSFTAPTAREAENEAYLWQTHCRMIGNDSSRMTVKEAMERYIEMNESDLSPSTVREYTRIVEKDMQDIINKPLYSLTCPIIKESMNKVSHLSTKTLKNRYGFLRTVLTTYHPDFVWAVTYPKPKKEEKQKKKQKQNKVFSNEQIKQIFKALKGTPFECEAYLGMLSLRASEIAGLKWSNVDLQNKTIEICETKLKNKDNQYVYVDDTKTILSTRTVYLPDYVCEILSARKETSTNEYVSTISPGAYWKRLNRLLDKHDITHISFHELRHIYSSVSSRLGIDTQIRMLNGGWANEHIMNGTYRHPMSEAQIEANTKMNAYVNTIAEVTTPTENTTQNTTEVTTKVTTQFKKRLKLARLNDIG